MKILVVEDNKDIISLLSEKLKNVKFDCLFSSSLKETIIQLKKDKYDAILLDLNLPDSFGLNTLRTLLKECPECPIIIFTVLEDDYTTIQAIHEGAQDYLIKDKTNEDTIIRSVRYAIERKRNENKLKEYIAEKQMIEDSQKESEQKYRAIVDYSPSMIWTVDRDGYYTFLNKTAEKISGYKSDDLIGKSFAPLLPKEESTRIMNIFHNILAGQSQRYEFSFINTRGSTKIISASGTPIYSKGKIVGVSNIGRDITEQKIAEEQLKKTKEQLERSNKELTNFAYIASHDLQQPLRTIVSYTELLVKKLRKKYKLDNEDNEYVDIIISSSIHMQEMIEDLLALSRIETKGKPFKQTSLSSVLNQVLLNLHIPITQNNAKITLGELPTIIGDETQLIQLFQNLIDNAIKFRQPNIDPKIDISAFRNDNEWMFTVTDNGIGIDPKNFDKLFIIFHRLHTDYPGTGIGLAICRKIVERHDGKIWIESELGKGSSFIFSIPDKIL